MIDAEFMRSLSRCCRKTEQPSQFERYFEFVLKRIVEVAANGWYGTIIRDIPYSNWLQDGEPNTNEDGMRVMMILKERGFELSDYYHEDGNFKDFGLHISWMSAK